MASLSISSLISFFAEEKKSIERGLNHCKSDHIEALTYHQGVLRGEVHASMKKKVYKVTVSLHQNRAIDRMNLTGKTVQETGLWLDGSGTLGASPDGIVDDSTLSMVPQVNSLCKTASYHLRNIARMRHLLCKESTEILAHAFVFIKTGLL